MKKRNTELTADAATAFPPDADPGSEEGASLTNSAPDHPPVGTAPSGPAEHGEDHACPEASNAGHGHMELATDGAIPEEPVGSPADVAEDSLPESMVHPLEKRVRRLEEMLAHLQDLNDKTPAPLAPTAQAVFVPMAKIASPTATPMSSPTASLLPPTAAALLAVAAQLQPGNPPPGPAHRSLWLLFDLVAEGRAILRMFVDPRYKMSWLGRIVPLLLIVTYFFWPWLPGLGAVSGIFLVIKFVDLIICFVLFKILSYEARRYRQTAPDLPPSLRL